jgi:hypothetical protein
LSDADRAELTALLRYLLAHHMDRPSASAPLAGSQGRPNAQRSMAPRLTAPTWGSADVDLGRYLARTVL